MNPATEAQAAIANTRGCETASATFSDAQVGVRQNLCLFCSKRCRVSRRRRSNRPIQTRVIVLVRDLFRRPPRKDSSSFSFRPAGIARSPGAVLGDQSGNRCGGLQRLSQRAEWHHGNALEHGVVAYSCISRYECACPAADISTRVTAVDRSGNESPPSAAASGGVPAESQAKP